MAAVSYATNCRSSCFIWSNSAMLGSHLHSEKRSRKRLSFPLLFDTHALHVYAHCLLKSKWSGTWVPQIPPLGPAGEMPHVARVTGLCCGAWGGRGLEDHRRQQTFRAASSQAVCRSESRGPWCTATSVGLLLLLGSPLAQPCRILAAVGSGFPDRDRFGRLKCLCELKLLPLPVASWQATMNQTPCVSIKDFQYVNFFPFNLEGYCHSWCTDQPLCLPIKLTYAFSWWLLAL